MATNQGGIDTETLLPLALVAGAGLLVWQMSKGQGGTTPPPAQTGWCVPPQILGALQVQVIGGQLVSGLPGRNPTLWHPTAVFRYYASMVSQQQLFQSLPIETQEALMQMTPEQAVAFTCLSCF